MVKPQLNLDKKDDLKKPDSNLVKVVTIGEEPAPLNPEPIYAPPTPRKRGCAFRFCLMSLLSIFVFVMTFLCIAYFMRFAHGGASFCGVGYYDDWNYDYYDDIQFDYGMDSYDTSVYDQGNKLPFGDDMLYPPRPTGPPIRRFLEEELDIDIELGLIRINRDGDDTFPGVNVLHDFNMNISAYMSSSDVCYIRPLCRHSVLAPEEFSDLLETEAFTYQDFPMRSELYTVNPEMVTDFVGEHIEEMCAGYSSYYISSIPSEQWHSFRMTVHEVFRDHFGGRRDGEGRGRHGGSSDEGRGRHGGGGRRHGGGGRHGGRDSSSSSSSSEEHGGRDRRFTRVRDFIDNMRSFDGQEVVDMHVFQIQNLVGLSPDNLKKLTDFAGEKMDDGEDFMP